MGPGLISGELAAKWALFLIRRGFRYVPVTYTGIALVNYFQVRLVHPAGPNRGRRPARPHSLQPIKM